MVTGCVVETYSIPSERFICKFETKQGNNPFVGETTFFCSTRDFELN
jgi:hypothetical protein